MLPKLFEIGVTDMSGANTNPVPLSAAIKVGVSGSSEGIERSALLAPVDAGLNTPSTVQLDDGVSTWLEQVSLCFINSVGSVPVNDNVPIVRSAVPLLVTVNVCGVDGLPTSTLPKSFVVGVTNMSGADTKPVPLSVTVKVGVSESSEGIDRSALFAPVDVGLNTASTVQLDDGVSS